MSAALLQALSSLRKACLELKAEAPASLRTKIDIMATVMARLIAEERDFPGLRQDLLSGYTDALSRLGEPMPAADTIATDIAPQLEQARARIQSALRGQRASTSPASVARPDLGTIARLEGAFATRAQEAITAEIRRGEGHEPYATSRDEAVDRAALRNFLIDSLGEPPTLEIVDVRLASRGFSKQTLFASLRHPRTLPQEIALRVDRKFNFLGTTVVDEFAPLVALHAAGIRVPRPIALEPTGQVLGGPFIVFEKKPGGLVGNNFQVPARSPALAADVARCLAQVHRVSPQRLPGVRGTGLAPDAQVRRDLDKSYADWVALERSVPVVEAAFSWLYAHLDLARGEPTVVHGDYNFNNLLVEDDRVSAIVDWEFLHIGHPAEDLGWIHYAAEGICGWEQFLRLYASAGGWPLDRRSLGFFVLLGQTRLAVMTLQTETGFDQGRFDDLRFGLASALYTNVSLTRLGTLLERLA